MRLEGGCNLPGSPCADVVGQPFGETKVGGLRSLSLAAAGFGEPCLGLPSRDDKDGGTGWQV